MAQSALLPSHSRQKLIHPSPVQHSAAAAAAAEEEEEEEEQQHTSKACQPGPPHTLTLLLIHLVAGLTATSC
jgi:hypothetical protein